MFVWKFSRHDFVSQKIWKYANIALNTASPSVNIPRYVLSLIWFYIEHTPEI
jgi:hypothetical protein